jgi:hypothetical protein
MNGCGPWGSGFEAEKPIPPLIAAGAGTCVAKRSFQSGQENREQAVFTHSSYSLVLATQNWKISQTMIYGVIHNFSDVTLV